MFWTSRVGCYEQIFLGFWEAVMRPGPIDVQNAQRYMRSMISLWSDYVVPPEAEADKQRILRSMRIFHDALATDDLAIAAELERQLKTFRYRFASKPTGDSSWTQTN